MGFNLINTRCECRFKIMTKKPGSKIMIDSHALRKNIGARLKEIGIKKGLKTRQSRAEFLDITPRCLSNWENGARLPAIEEFFKIAETYKIPLPYVVCWTDDLETGKMPLHKEVIAKVIVSEIYQ